MHLELCNKSLMQTAKAQTLAIKHKASVDIINAPNTDCTPHKLL